MLAAGACLGAAPEAPAATATPTEAPAAPTATRAPVEPTATATPAPLPTATAAPQRTLWKPEHGGLWLLGEGQPQMLLGVAEARARFPWWTDASAAAMQVLLASRFPDHGAGPGNVSVSDLWLLDLETGEERPIVAQETVVEARWAPDGEHFAYLRMTPETHELVWRSLAGGEERVLATGAALKFSVSPSSRAVAFTRESGYGMEIEPGLYVVEVSSGEERRVAEVDVAGAGSIGHRPAWSPDGRQLLLPVPGSPEEARGTLRAAADGSGAAFLEPAEALLEEPWGEQPPWPILWHPDGRRFVGLVELMLPPRQWVILYQMDGARISGAQVLAEGEELRLAGWRVPGHSVWVQRGEPGSPPEVVELP